MELKNSVETVIIKRLKRNQMLLGVSILIALGVAYMGMRAGYTYDLFALYFVIMGAFTLPAIHQCKKDLLAFQRNRLSFTEGKLVDVFPEKDGSGMWTLFLKVQGEKEIVEFSVPTQPSVSVDATIKVHHTPLLKVPVRVDIVG
ncbi:hypothetical protein PP175_26590 (plasmid) [Aneurinibacillus sp. Ricciae_BoGa-3]|uniref:hypothetical protein n=1 Tax=Aneurinibacillus sp. Ricciae_BoGa-3 TaxID=3022697 RepID=UPI002340BA5C|nr:hypothetical protein [Aneurinibacillus sp. Ricciae_BoGa-3]WCK57634.1 hypothetical protein PP175_26590 [Aneurinibacillus sp. Ricciae_BoGa-3]